VIVDVDEPRGDYESAGVDGPLRRLGAEFAQGNNAITLNRHIANERRIASPVNDAAIPYQKVVVLRERRRRAQEKDQQKHGPRIPVI
jgi:hypothetical protein